jgi:hypothetical protein
VDTWVTSDGHSCVIIIKVVWFSNEVVLILQRTEK